jgi:hypothetical protein
VLAALKTGSPSWRSSSWPHSQPGCWRWRSWGDRAGERGGDDHRHANAHDLHLGRPRPERRRHEARLADIERATARAVQAGEEQAQRELADQEAADRRAQADAVARALRRP